MDNTDHKSSHSPDGTVQIIRRSTSEKSLGGDYSKGRFKQRLGRGTTTGCKRIRQRSHYWTIRTATIEAKSQGRPPVRLAETFVHCTECNIRRPSPAPQATEFGYPSIQTRMQIEREAKHDRQRNVQNARQRSGYADCTRCARSISRRTNLYHSS